MYLRILVHVVAFTILTAIAGGCLSAVAGHHPDAVIFVFLGACTGAILGGIAGATRTLLLELPDAIERAHFVRKIRDIDDFSQERKAD